MTHEQFKDICLKEFPLIEGMVKKVKALGVDYVSCDVYADGSVNFQIHEKDDKAFHTAWHQSNMAQGELQIVEYDGQGISEWKPACFYDHAIDNDPDATEDDLPFC